MMSPTTDNDSQAPTIWNRLKRESSFGLRTNPSVLKFPSVCMPDTLKTAYLVIQHSFTSGTFYLITKVGNPCDIFDNMRFKIRLSNGLTSIINIYQFLNQFLTLPQVLIMGVFCSNKAQTIPISKRSFCWILSLPLSGQIQQTTNWWQYSYFSQETGFDISCKLSPLETMCMECQICFME